VPPRPNALESIANSKSAPPHQSCHIGTRRAFSLLPHGQLASCLSTTAMSSDFGICNSNNPEQLEEAFRKLGLSSIAKRFKVPFFELMKVRAAASKQCPASQLQSSVNLLYLPSHVKKTSHLKSLLNVSRVPFPCINNARRSTRLPTSFWTNSIVYSSLEASTTPYPKVL
jgi:hypothetical protein